MKVWLTLYTRQDCCLCEDMQDTLEDFKDEFNFDIELVDIDRDATLKARYDTQVPVLSAGETLICQYTLDLRALREFFHSAVPTV